MFLKSLEQQEIYWKLHLNLDGYPVIISDTAGIRKSQDEIENKGIKLAIKKAEEADLKTNNYRA